MTKIFKERKQKRDYDRFGDLLKDGRINVYVHDTDATYTGFLLRLTLSEDGKVIRERMSKPGTVLCIQPCIIS